jgi:hypothetical protein
MLRGVKSVAMQITFTLRQQDFFESIIAIRDRKPWMKWRSGSW